MLQEWFKRLTSFSSVLPTLCQLITSNPPGGVGVDRPFCSQRHTGRQTPGNPINVLFCGVQTEESKLGNNAIGDLLKRMRQLISLWFMVLLSLGQRKRRAADLQWRQSELVKVLTYIATAWKCSLKYLAPYSSFIWECGYTSWQCICYHILYL